MNVISRFANISACGTYRYSLHRTWDTSRPPLAWIMLNPSTADAYEDDNTIRRVISFTQREERYGSAVVLNLYALRATNPKMLARHGRPVGPDNDAILNAYALSSCDMVAAWGAHAPLRAAGVLMGPLRNKSMLCLGKTKDGHPRHPLYVPGDQPFEVFR